MPKLLHPHKRLSRRDFLKAGVAGTSALLAAGACTPTCIPVTSTPSPTAAPKKNSVSVVETTGGIRPAVEEAIRLLGGAERVFGKSKNIMLKPNLVSDSSNSTTNPEVVGWLANLIRESRVGGEQRTVSIGEGSAAAAGYNVFAEGPCYTDDEDTLNDLQDHVFQRLGYKDLAAELSIELINLHTGPMATVELPDGLAYKKLTIHKSLIQTDLLVSVPMMKTHYMASVSLGMKNLIGLYPGTKYGTVRYSVHEEAYNAGSDGVAFETIDMVRANRLGLTIIDATTAMEGNGPTNGDLVPMNLIVAGTNPLATDMIGAYLMGYCPDEIPTFVWARRMGMGPQSLNDIVVRGLDIVTARRMFKRPDMHTWPDERGIYYPC
ncbi:MAG: DUF362 domain-containing protein [Anaerolineales bacterium]|nr:DUF362 domain-containing protein [Anaerolineales bacterium]